MLWAAGVLPMGLGLGLRWAQGDSKCMSSHVEAVPHSLGTHCSCRGLVTIKLKMICVGVLKTKWCTNFIFQIADGIHNCDDNTKNSIC